jgi:hypothetical protein
MRLHSTAMAAAALVALSAMAPVAPVAWAAGTTPPKEPNPPVYVQCKLSAAKDLDRLARALANAQIGVSAMKANVRPDGQYRDQDVRETRAAMHKLRVLRFGAGGDDVCVGPAKGGK